MDNCNQSQGDFEGFENASWNEAEWAEYLRNNSNEINRFLSYYCEEHSLSDRLDHSAKRMGWENTDWAPNDTDVDEYESETESLDMPYCIQQHPIYIVARALSTHLYNSFIKLCDSTSSVISSVNATNVMRSFWNAEHQMVMAINATDTGELPLALVHMKHALYAINYAIGQCNILPLSATNSSKQITKDIESTLFDLREVCLRVMSDCRWDQKLP